MSLRPTDFGPVPEATARVARAAFRYGSPYLRLRDELGAVFADAQFAALFSHRGRPAECPARLALVSVFQFAEGLADRQAADAVRGRLDWKYALGLELDDPGFDASVLSEFRARLVTGDAVHRLLDTVVERARALGLLGPRGRQRTDSTHVLAAVRAMTRLECVGEAMRAALNALAVAAPEWLRQHVAPAWFERYALRRDDFRLPKGDAKRAALAVRVGEDGHALLVAIAGADAPRWVREVPMVEMLRRVWVQQYYVDPTGRVHWRQRVPHGLPPARAFLSSPYDADAHYAHKHTTSWVGYKVHLTETCDDGQPRLITHVETTAAPVADGEATPVVHAALAERDLLPDRHLVDAGYLDAPLLVTSRAEYGVDLVGPTRLDHKWQAQASEGFAAAQFPIDWARQRATCPAGHESSSWTPAIDRRKNAVIKIKFSQRDCLRCPVHDRCTRAARRTVTVRPEAQHLALQAARGRATTPDYAREYARRAGIEGTLSQGVRRCGLRRSRYRGCAKTHLQHVLTAIALNLIRLTSWLAGETPETTRRSAFATLMLQAA